MDTSSSLKMRSLKLRAVPVEDCVPGGREEEQRRIDEKDGREERNGENRR